MHKTPIFPRHTVEVVVEYATPVRRFTFSLPEMALLTGVVIRLFRMLALTHGSNEWWYIGGTFTVGLVLLLGLLTTHLANYPLNQYWWRALAFAGLEILGEMSTSLLLIWLGREPNGTVRAHIDDWPTMAVRALLYRGLAIVIWSLLLSFTVQLTRRTIVHEDDERIPVPRA